MVPFKADAAAAPASRHRRYAYSIAAVVFGICAALVLGESSVRIFKPTPATQVVRGYGLHSVDGVPVWEEARDRYNRACVEQHPERKRILFFGSSITFGSRLDANETFTSLLEARLNQLRPTPGFCVLNFAQPGFSFEQKYAVARKEVARYQPALIMWESWVEWMGYSLIGDTAYGTFHYALRPDGCIGIAGVPDPLNRALFLHSRLYEYLALRFGERATHGSDDEQARLFANNRLIQVPRLAESVDAKLVLYLAPPLDRSFADTAAAPPDWHRVLLEFARAHGVAAYLLQRELNNHDYLQLRMDPCCHYNAAGHRTLAPIMVRIVLEQLDSRPTTP